MGNRLARLTVAFSMFTAIFAANVPSPLYVIYQHRYHFSSLVVTEIFAGYSLGVLLALFVVGQISDRIGRKPVLVAGAVLLLGSEALFLVTNGPLVLFVARTVQGAAIGVLSSAATAALVELEPEGHEQRAALVNVLTFTGGGAIGTICTGYFAQYLPHPTGLSYVLVAALNVVSIATLFALGEPARHLTRAPFRVLRPTVPAAIARPFAIASLTVAIGWSIGGIYGSLSPSMVGQILHQHSHLVAGAVLCLFNIVGGTCQILLQRRSPRFLMAGAVVTSMLGVALVEGSLLMRSTPLFFASTVFSGTGTALSFVGSLALINKISPEKRRAEVVSSYSVIGYVALSLPVVGIGLLTNHIGLGPSTSVFVVIVIVASIAALVLLGPSWYEKRPTVPAVWAGRDGTKTR